MWHKTKKVLESRLADSLQRRVYYSCAVYDLVPSQMVFYIKVDNETWFATNPNIWYDKAFECRDKERSYAESIATIETGTVGDADLIMKMIHDYLNVYTIDECWKQDNYFYHILAILDRRTGKCRIEKLLENIDNEPEWLRKYINLRAGFYGLIP